VKAFGRRHVTYGVRPEHYYTVGAALLWTLEQRLGAAFTPAVREAWVAAYGVLANTMRDATEMSA
jgi:hemoglobin-like flavoprotein